MSTSPAKDPVPGIVTFADRGDAALDRLAAALVADCDGSPASIADILEQVLSADIDELADKLDEPMAAEVVPESPDAAARRRFGSDRGTAAGTAPPPPSIGR